MAARSSTSIEPLAHINRAEAEHLINSLRRGFQFSLIRRPQACCTSRSIFLEASPACI
jgi:hypothetical protein